MRLAEDERGRVPFALLGVLLLVGSLAVATIQLDRGQVDRDATLAGDRAEAAAVSVLRETTRDAGATAAANPVVGPADTEFGRLLDRDRPYRSYLELLIALGLRERLRTNQQRVDEATATVDLAPITNNSTADAAMEQVHVESRRRGLVSVTVASVPIVVRQGGTVVDRRTRSLSANVTTPTLTLHDRTTAFQDRLDGATLESGSLSRGLTGGLYGLGWTRGYGQYAGLPIADVIANRHVELVTNLAVLDAQRASFGDSDQGAEEDLVAETARVAANETVGVQAGGLLDAALPDPSEETPSLEEAIDSPERTTTVGVNETADRALADLVRNRVETHETETDDAVPSTVPDGTDRPTEYPLETVVRTANSVNVSLSTARREGEWRRIRSADSPGANWTRSDSDRTDVVVHAVRAGDGPRPAARDSTWRRDRVTTRRVVLDAHHEVTFEHENGSTRSTDAVHRREVGVGIALDARPLRREWIPSAPLTNRPDGRFAALSDAGRSALLSDNGGIDELASTVATEGPVRDSTIREPESVGDATDVAYEGLAGLRETVRPIDVTVETGALLSDAMPNNHLLAVIDQRRTALLDLPGTFRGLDRRAAAAARVLYLERLDDRLRAREQATGGLQSAVEEKVGELSMLPRIGLEELLSVGTDYVRPDPAPLSARPPVPDLSLTVDGDPSYLGLEQVNETVVPPPGGRNATYYPLGARTSTIASLPTGPIEDAIVSITMGLFGMNRQENRQIPLSTAARALAGAEAVPANLSAEYGIEASRAELRSDVNDSAMLLRDQPVTNTVMDETAMSRREARGLVRSTVDHWDSPSSLALAIVNGSAATAVGTALAREPGYDDLDGDRIATLIRDRTHSRLDSDDVQVDLGTTETVTARVRNVTQAVVEEQAAVAVERAQQRIVDRLGERFSERLERAPVVNLQGVPVLPYPGWWLATANIWRVEVQGTYASFAVRARQGGPSGGGQVSYVRDGGEVAVDVTGDGQPELLGRSNRISFSASTTVAVAVPANGGGIGNDEPGFTQTSPGFAYTEQVSESECREFDEHDAAESYQYEEGIGCIADPYG